LCNLMEKKKQKKKKKTAVWEIRNYDICNIRVKKKNTQFGSYLLEYPGKPWHGNYEQPELRDKHA